MKFTAYFTSSVGKKIIMAITGTFLVVFLVVHLGLNACIWANDGGAMFNAGAHFMGNNWVPRLLEVGLFVGIILHIIQGVILEFSNRSKRGVAYKVSLGNKASTWYSRSMGLLGTLILLFLIIHLNDFWIPNRSHQNWLMGEEINLFEKMKEVFSSPTIVTIYMVGCFSLSYHLAHGVQSASRTFGLLNTTWHNTIKIIGYLFAIIVPILFALMPLSFYFGWVI